MTGPRSDEDDEVYSSRKLARRSRLIIAAALLQRPDKSEVVGTVSSVRCGRSGDWSVIVVVNHPQPR